MTGKREHPDGDPSRNGVKRPRSNRASPAPALQSSGADGKASAKEQLASARERAAAVAARYGGNSASPSTAPPAQQSSAGDARARLEALKAKVNAATSRAGLSSHTPSAPVPQPQKDEAQSKGLGIALHPLLMGDVGSVAGNKFKTSSAKDQKLKSQFDRQPTDVKSKYQLDISGPSADEIKQNPYYDPNVSGAGTTGSRKSRNLIFNQQGKYIAQATALRRQHQLEEMKVRLAKQAKLTAVDEDRSEQSFVVPQPPAMEWWDEGLVQSMGDVSAYPDFDDDAMAAEKLVKIDTEDSIITQYVQHPVLLDPPQLKTIPLPKPLYLTKEEQAKMRRQRRKADLQEKQAKQRLGLIDPEKPKVSQKNLMRVLGEDAVRDPTAVEAQVNREIAERREKHEEMNEDRKLTKEQRHEKLSKQQEGDAAKGIFIKVYRIGSLAHGKHRYLIDMNAKQHALTGITILNPRFNLVIVEGGEYSIRQYDKLMMQRIKWSDISAPRESTKEPISTVDKEISEAKWLQPEDEQGHLKDLSENRCVRIWEGEEKQRAFKKWGSRVAHTEQDARSVLEKAKMENMWQLAKNYSD